MRVRQTITATGNGTPIALDMLRSPFNASFHVTVPAGVTASYKIQFTLDDLNNPAIATPDWTDDANVGAGTTASATGNYMFPVTFIRAVVATLTGGTATLVLTVLQGNRDA